jgi:hypothetical protein
MGFVVQARPPVAPDATSPWPSLDPSSLASVGFCALRSWLAAAIADGLERDREAMVGHEPSETATAIRPSIPRQP